MRKQKRCADGYVLAMPSLPVRPPLFMGTPRVSLSPLIFIPVPVTLLFPPCPSHTSLHPGLVQLRCHFGTSSLATSLPSPPTLLPNPFSLSPCSLSPSPQHRILQRRGRLRGLCVPALGHGDLIWRGNCCWKCSGKVQNELSVSSTRGPSGQRLGNASGG